MEKITFIFDLDGTLIDPSKYEVSNSTMNAIKKLKELGYPCLIATGRAYSSVCQTVVKELIEWDGYICSNGQHVLDQHGQSIHKYVMDKERVELAVELAKSYEMNVQFQGEPSFLLKEVNDVVKKAHSFFHEPIPTVVKEYEGEDLDMLMIYHEDTDKLLSFKSIPGLDVYLGRSTYADIVDIGQSKFRGIQTYFDSIKKTVQYVAFGDSDNDMDMIENAFIGVAMGNATEELKSLSSYVTTSVDQDGIALGIEYILKTL
jgi:Cof subfamily protein (haloacid dehalogenase superfamily)